MVIESKTNGTQRKHGAKFLTADLVIVGGGLAGTCCAITAAREGLRVVLIQDRPILGGNASSEVRLWVLGATSHMGNNNRWAREGGVIDELLVENMWRNPEGNPVIMDSVILEKVAQEPRITLLLNTAVHDVVIQKEGLIQSVSAFCSQNQITYTVEANLFVDASGDGIVGYLAGADFRMGAEAAREFDEALAPEQETNHLLGHSLYFYSRDTGHPVRFIPPGFAITDISTIPRYREIRVSDSGCRLWWLEYGGNLDTVHQTEEIKWELWRVAYGVWNYIKNSGIFPEAENLTLEWMGTIPGKRESRRFLGDFILSQRDIIEQRTYPDAVSFGGWAIDLHPPEGVFSSQPGCVQWHSKGVYQIPFRTMYSRNIGNLFLAGRLISTTHIAFGSTRVMATCAHNGQAVAMGAVLCAQENLLPRDLLEPKRMHTLQQRLLRIGQHIPGVASCDEGDLARRAHLSASSTLLLSELKRSSELAPSDSPLALLLPAVPGSLPQLTFYVHAEVSTTLIAELWCSSRSGNTTPDTFLERVQLEVPAGSVLPAEVAFRTQIKETSYVFVIIPPFAGGALYISDDDAPGILTLSQKMNAAVSKSPIQRPPADSGVDSFAFWLPERRPKVYNLATRFSPPLDRYRPANVIDGFARPWNGVHAWAPAREDSHPTLTLSWDESQMITSIQITFDTDFDHPMESVLMTHAERIMPGCITAFQIKTHDGRILADISENHQTRWNLTLDDPVTTTSISVEVLAHGPGVPAIFEVRCY